MIAVPEGRTMGFSWIPNISGRVTSPENLEKCIGSSDEANGMRLVFELTEDDYSVSVSSNGFSIVPCDEHGFCRIVTGADSAQSLMDDSENREFVFSVKRIWLLLCKKLDDSGYGLAISIGPVQSTEDDPYRLIADSMLEAVEDTTSFVEANRSLKIRIFRAMRLNRSVRCLVIYAYRYLDIYGDRMGAERHDYEVQVRCREDLNGAVMGFLESRYGARTDRTMKAVGWLTLMSTFMLSLADYLKP